MMRISAKKIQEHHTGNEEGLDEVSLAWNKIKINLNNSKLGGLGQLNLSLKQLEQKDAITYQLNNAFQGLVTTSLNQLKGSFNSGASMNCDSNFINTKSK